MHGRMVGPPSVIFNSHFKFLDFVDEPGLADYSLRSSFAYNSSMTQWMHPGQICHYRPEVVMKPRSLVRIKVLLYCRVAFSVS